MHHNFDDSDSGYDLEGDQQNKQVAAGGNSGGKNFGMGGYRGRIIFLGDGTEVLTDEAGDDEHDANMFDGEEEDRDLISQVGGRKVEDVTDEKEEVAEKKEKVEGSVVPDKITDELKDLKDKVVEKVKGEHKEDKA